VGGSGGGPRPPGGAPAPRPKTAPPRPGGAPRRAVTPRAHPTPVVAVRTVRLPQTPAAEQVAIDVPARTTVVRLEIPAAAEGPPSYDAVVRRAGGGEVWRVEGVVPPAPGEPITVDVPARVLVAGDYQLSLEAEVLRDARRSPWPTLRFSLRVQRSR